MADITPIQFIHQDAPRILQEMQTDLEVRLNRQIAPSDIEMLLIQAFAYRETLIRTGVNEAARQNLVSFARGAALEYLGELVGVSRQPASFASTIIQFNMVPGHDGLIIPLGMRVGSLDGKMIFQTIEEKIVAPGVNAESVKTVCTTAGVDGNGYAINQISLILDPQAYVATASNIGITAGGADEESDDKLRERIKLAPASFSVAGPTDAYKFFAKSAHPSIVDVAVTSPIPGEVHIFPLLDGGIIPSEEILDDVFAICNGDKIRPLTDTVIVSTPTIIDYDIKVALTLLTAAIGATIQSRVQTILNNYVDSRKNKMGLDVVKSKIASLCMIEGVYDVNVELPVATIVADADEYTRCLSIIVNVTGNHDE